MEATLWPTGRECLCGGPLGWREMAFADKGQRLLLSCDEFEADRGRNGNVVAGGSELAGGSVDVEGNDGVAELIFGEEEISGRVESEVAGFFAAGGHAAFRCERAFFRVDIKNGDAVRAAIGDVEKSSAGMDGDFGDVVAAGKVGGNGGNAIDLFQITGFRVVRKAGGGGNQFADDEEEFAVGRKDSVARAGAGLERRGGRNVGAEGAFLRVKLENENLIQA